MARINTESIEGYADMTPEQKVQALEALELKQDEPTDVSKLKAALNRASSEAANYKHQLQEKMSDDERKEAERKEAQEKIEQELTALKREKVISTHYKSCKSMGFDDESAQKAAEALEQGNYDDFWKVQQKFLSDHDTAIRAAALNQQPELTRGQPLTQKAIDDQETAQLRKWAGL